MSLDDVHFGNSLLHWLIAGGVCVATLVAAIIAKYRVLAWLRRFAERTETCWDDLLVGALGRTRTIPLLLGSVWAGSVFVDLDPSIHRTLRTLAILGAWIQVGLWVHGGMVTWQQAKRAAGSASAAGTSIIGFLVRLVAWTFCALMALSNLGVDITALVTGLGIGGIAIALAVQNILGDLFASLTIALDKPFEPGDFIVVGDHMGTVEHVGLKNTRLRSLGGEQIVCANSDLLGSRIRNYKRMRERRILFAFGVEYDTPTPLLERIPDWVREIVSAQPLLRMDRVHFKEFGASSLDFEAVYYIASHDYNTHMDALQRINLALLDRFRKEGVAFAFPTRTLHLASMPAAAAAVAAD